MSRTLAEKLSGGSKRLTCLLKASVGISNGHDGPEEDHWVVGGRYQVINAGNLHQRPEVSSDPIGQIRPKDNILLLALQTVLSLNGTEVLVAYVANTKNVMEWVSGWCQIEASAEGGYPQILRRRRQPGGWEVGGRYLVSGNPVLRRGIELESDQMREVMPDEEVLVIDLGLVIRSGEPRLRARVRTDTGDLGWLTIELPGGHPLLEPLNLYSIEALTRKSTHFGEKHRKNGGGQRVNLSGRPEHSDEAWEPHGRYRLAERITVHEEADLNSRIIGELRRGSMVTVAQVQHLATVSDRSALRLQVSNDHTPQLGWLSPLAPNGEALLDARDHQEFEKIIRLQIQAQELAEHEEAQAPRRQQEPVSPEEKGNHQSVSWQDVPQTPLDNSYAPPLVAPWEDAAEADPMSVSPTSMDFGQATGSASGSQEASPNHYYQEPNVSLMAAHAKIADAEAAVHNRQNDKLNGSHNIARLWDHGEGSGYRAFHEMDSAQDTRQVGDSIENEDFNGICSCRNGLLNCSAEKLWNYATKEAPSRPYYPQGAVGLDEGCSMQQPYSPQGYPNN